MLPMPADIRQVAYEDLEKLVSLYEKKAEWYKQRAGRSMLPSQYANLDRLYNELDRRDGLLDDDYQLIIREIV